MPVWAETERCYRCVAMARTAARRAGFQRSDQLGLQLYIPGLRTRAVTVSVWRLPAHGARRSNLEEVQLGVKVWHVVMGEGLLQHALVRVRVRVGFRVRVRVRVGVRGRGRVGVRVRVRVRVSVKVRRSRGAPG